VLLRPAKTSAFISPGTSHKVNDLQDLDPRICPVLLHGSETWVLKKREENRLLVFERKILCTIYGPTIEYGVFRNRYNFEFNSPNVIGVVKNYRLRYAGHMIRGTEDLPQRFLYRAVPKGKQNQGRPKSRWAVGMNSDSRAFEAIDWTNFSRDRVQWRDLLRQALTKSWFY
jgi:hypothetical protein